MHWLDYFIIATYCIQVFQIFFYSVPSAGSTREMLSNRKQKCAAAGLHPGSRVVRSAPKIALTVALTLAVAAAALIPLMTLIFPGFTRFLLPLGETPAPGLSILSACLLVCGNSLTVIAVAALKAHVRFRDFGEAERLHTTGIYGVMRNPITLGLAAVFAGFALARPSVVMLLGLVLFLVNAGYRIRMEEAYLDAAFGDEYIQYRRKVGKYIPKI